MGKRKVVVKNESNSWQYARIGALFFIVSDVFGLVALNIQGLIWSNLTLNIVANVLIMGFLFFEPNNKTLRLLFK